MGIVDYPIIDLIGKVRSLASNLPEVFPESLMSTAGESLGPVTNGCRCSSCSGFSDMDGAGQLPVCHKPCYRCIGGTHDTVQQCVCMIGSPVVLTEFAMESPVSSCSSNKLDCLRDSQQIYSPQPIRNLSFRCFEEDGGYESSRPYFSQSSDFSQDTSDMESTSVGTTNELYSFRSANSSPLESPYMTFSRDSASPLFRKYNLYNQGSTCHFPKTGADLDQGSLENSNESMYGNVAIGHNQQTKESILSLDLENDELWDPPLTEDEDNCEEAGFFEYSDEEDDVSDSAKSFSSSSFCDAYRAKANPDTVHKEVLRSAIHGHFRALVSQLLNGEGINFRNENEGHGWLDIVSSLAWQAANYVKPDTSKGGSMDPGDYIKVKCIASGNPNDSVLVKGVVCTKNLRHKRMISQFRNPKLLLIGGAFEYHKVPNELASINTLLEQEIDHLNMVLGKIEALGPNILLVEKSVSSYAQEKLLAKKDVSLVPNVKRSLLERIARCTGAQIAPSVDSVTLARLGHCAIFQIEKVFEEDLSMKHSKKSSTKTLMFFEGCPRRLGCTVLLRGTCLEELKKVKHAIQYACFAAYHLSLETSFFADEGASLPQLQLGSPSTTQQLKESDSCISKNSVLSCTCKQYISDVQREDELCTQCNVNFLSCPSDVTQLIHEKAMLGASPEQQDHKHKSEKGNSSHFPDNPQEYRKDGSLTSATNMCLDQSSYLVSGLLYEEPCNSPLSPSYVCFKSPLSQELVATISNSASERPSGLESKESRMLVENRIGVPGEYFPTADSQQSILVSLSITCMRKGTVCERSQLFRIKFYGRFDKPLGRFLCDDLFNQTLCCHSCKEPTDAHVRCYTHQQGSLSLSVKRLPLKGLPGERDGKIWMWHRCLKCEPKNGVPPASRRVLMSDAAWGLSFGKFLELSFSNHTTANRVASCGHSLQRDCLRFFGCGSMVGIIRYSPVDILSVHLPSFLLEFTCKTQQEWLRQEAKMISNKIDILHEEISNLLEIFGRKITTLEDESLKRDILKLIMELKELLNMEKNDFDVLIQPLTVESIQHFPLRVDILDLNRLRRELLICSYEWDCQLCLLDSLSKGKGSPSKIDLQYLDIPSKDKMFGSAEEASLGLSTLLSPSQKSSFSKQHDLSVRSADVYLGQACSGVISQQICTSNYSPFNAEARISTVLETSSLSASEKNDLPETCSGFLSTDQRKSHSTSDSFRKINTPVRVYSFDSALRLRKRAIDGYYPFSLHGTTIKSFDYSRDLTSMGRDSTPNMRRAYSQSSPRSVKKLDVLHSHIPVFISSSSCLVNDGVRLMLPQNGLDDTVISVFDDEPTSIISYALTSKEYNDYARTSLNNVNAPAGYSATAESFAPRQPVTHLLSENANVFDDHRPIYQNISDSNEVHFKMSFDDEYSFPSDKVKFSVTCYFAKQFDSLRKNFCPIELDYIRSLCRCKRWNAQGGKSNVYFAKSWDERFIIKQVTKTELDSFNDFACEYFKYLSESISSGSPTCLAKVLGIYQVTVRHLKGGKEWKMDFMVMENLFFGKKISRVYDLKGSLRSRYNPDTSGSNKVLLDMNLLETLGTNPILLGSKAKRSLERAVWNDTSFLASVDVMDYSLLAGIDEERKELVIGIIDFMRQYTWDKHLETWVKASGILGGPRDELPTIISPIQYKKRFRKAMSKYFLTVPDQWSS